MLSKFKKFIGLILVVTLPMVISVPTFAQDSPINLSKITDTTSYTQKQYLDATKLSNQNTLRSESSDESVLLTCEAFLAIAKASVRKPDTYSPAELVLPADLDKDTIQYRLTDYEYQSEQNKALNHIISNDNLDFSDFTVSYKSDEAIASIVESYTYKSNDGFDGTNFRKKKYTLNLKNTDGKWQITDVKTNDPWETAEGFKYKPIDVSAAVSNLVSENTRLKDNTSVANEDKLKKANVLTNSGLYRWNYYTSDAVAYAKAHFNNYNDSVFGSHPSDCQNFASQCVWAGLGGSGSDKTARPAVPTSRVGTNAFNVWCNNQATTYYKKNILNFAWDNVDGFMKLISASTSSTEGPFGDVSYSNALQNASVGDVLAVRWSGGASEGNMDHAIFVTEVSGRYGSRTKSDIKIAAHTDDSDTAYMPLADYVGSKYGSKNFGRSCVFCGYYKVSQP